FDPLELKLDALHLMPVTERGAFLEQKAALDRALESLPSPEPPPPEPEPEPVAAMDESLPEGDDAQPEEDRDDDTSEAPAPAPARPSPAPPASRPTASDDGGGELLGDDLTDIE